MEVGAAERNPEGYGGGEPPLNQRSSEELEAAGRLEEIHRYLSDLYARREVVARTVTPQGQLIDWIPIESQTPDGKIAEPPDEDRPMMPRGGTYPAEPGRFELQAEDAELGPPGTVPVVCLPIELIRPEGDLQDWLAKGGKAWRLRPPDDPGRSAGFTDDKIRKYALAYQYVLNYGTEGIINKWRPFVDWSDELSLGQFWVSRGDGLQTQTIEAGHQAYRNQYGDWEPHLFIYYTTNNYTQSGDDLGGYNQNVRGWVQRSQVIFPAALSQPPSQFDGPQFELGLKVQLSGGNWWIRVNGEWMGYYPTSLFNATGLHFEASEVHWGGEVTDQTSHPETTGTDMGSSHFPWEGFRRSAYMSNLLVQFTRDGALARFQGEPYVTHPMCYDLKADFSHTGDFGSHFFWGGSGRNGSCP